MTVFVIVAALLVIITIGLLFLPLLKSSEKQQDVDSAALSMQVLREQLLEVEQALASGQMDAATAEKEKRELERRALEENTAGEIHALNPAPRAMQRKLMVAAVIAIPLMAAGLYWILGNPTALSPAGTEEASVDQASGKHSLSPQQIAAMTEKLAERLAANPADGEGWLMLGRSYAMMGRHGEAAAAYGRAISYLPPNAGLYADYADVLAMAQGRRLSGEPEKIIAKALSLEPNHIKALALSGSAAFEQSDFRRAVSEWQKILLLVPPDSNIAQSVQGSIADAQSRLGGPVPAAASTPAASNASIGGTVSIDPKVTSNVSPSDTVFIFARATEGSRMPLALQRMTVAQLPADFMLDDSMAMAPNARLSGVKQVIVGARISKSGSATPQPGDYEGLTRPLAVGSQKIRLVINTPVK